MESGKINADAVVYWYGFANAVDTARGMIRCR